MSYQQALEKAWNAVSDLPHNGGAIAIKLLSDTYTIDIKNKTILSDSCNIPAKEHVSIIILPDYSFSAISSLRPYRQRLLRKPGL